MYFLIFTIYPEYCELMEMPSERVIAAGTLKAVEAAARLFQKPYYFATFYDVAERDMRERMDNAIIGDLDGKSI
ncbi:MAG TPA: hypothetical protein VI423_08125 [Paenisporosarcina sp.]|nr:hypothetical protein [Paenisporosarcina sp.]